MRTGFTRSIKRTCIIRAPRFKGRDNAFARQGLLDGKMQEKFADAEVLLVGSGGINAPIALDLARKGIGSIVLVEYDTIEDSNLSRTPFRPKDIGKNKAIVLQKILKGHCLRDTTVTAYPLPIQKTLEAEPDAFRNADLIIVGVDNDDTRFFVCDRALENKVPAIFLGVSATALNGSVFVQKPGGKPCFRCLRPETPDSKATRACVPACLDINRAVGGYALYVTTAILCGWNLNWNYYGIILTGESIVSNIHPKSECRCAGVTQ